MFLERSRFGEMTAERPVAVPRENGLVGLESPNSAAAKAVSLVAYLHGRRHIGMECPTVGLGTSWPIDDDRTRFRNCDFR